jgi:hypothetical protein
MKTLLIATVAAFALTGAGIATAQTSVGADVDLNARNNAQVGTHTTVHKRKYHRRMTTGIETRDNNASARGTVLPGKDRLNSKAYIADH